MLARVPEDSRDRARALNDKDTAGEATPEEAREAMSLFWASYFAHPVLPRRCRTSSSPSRPVRGCGRTWRPACPRWKRLSRRSRCRSAYSWAS